MTNVTAPPAPRPAVNTAAGVDRSGGPRLVTAELRKVFTTNTWWLIGIFDLVLASLTLLINVLQGNDQLANVAIAQQQPPPDFSQVPPEQRPSVADQQAYLDQYRSQTDLARVLAVQASNIYTSGQFFGLLFVAVLGALVVTNEYYHQTATATFLATPQRTRVIAAKAVAAVVLAGLFWAVITALSVLVGALDLSSHGYDIQLTNPDVLRAVGMNLLAYVLWAVLGIGLGILMRSQIAATVTSVILYLISLPAALIVWNLLYAYVIRNDAIWDYIVIVPGVASMVMVYAEPLNFGPTGSPSPSWWVGMLVLIGYAAAAGTIGTLVTRRRDIS